jgi:hypothetical protein
LNSTFVLLIPFGRGGQSVLALHLAGQGFYLGLGEVIAEVAISNLGRRLAVSNALGDLIEVIGAVVGFKQAFGFVSAKAADGRLSGRCPGCCFCRRFRRRGMVLGQQFGELLFHLSVRRHAAGVNAWVVAGTVVKPLEVGRPFLADVGDELTGEVGEQAAAGLDVVDRRLGAIQ